MPKLPVTPSKIEHLLKLLNITPRKRYGQNFLFDNDIQKKIASSADLAPEDIILEIGPGLGHLSRFLISGVKRLIVVEIDEKLADFVEKNFPSSQKF